MDTKIDCGFFKFIFSKSISYVDFLSALLKLGVMLGIFKYNLCNNFFCDLFFVYLLELSCIIFY